MKILEQIKPTEEEKRSIKKLIESVLKKIKIEDAKFELGGSYAKDTFLTGNYDIDIFVTYGDWSNPGAHKTVRRIRGVRFTSMGQEINLNGSPIQESYTFLARNVL